MPIETKPYEVIQPFKLGKRLQRLGAQIQLTAAQATANAANILPLAKYRVKADAFINGESHAIGTELLLTEADAGEHTDVLAPVEAAK